MSAKTMPGIEAGESGRAHFRREAEQRPVLSSVAARMQLTRPSAMKTPVQPSSSTETNTPPRRYVPKPKGSWRKLVGTMKDCDLAPEAFRLGAEWRERMNREGR